MSAQFPDRLSTDQLLETIQADDVEGARLLLDHDRELRAAINGPIGPFDSPALNMPGAAR